MAKQQSTWAIVATVDEPPAVVQAFVAWHLALGADEVLLYFDRPEDPAAGLFDHIDAVSVTRCDDTYWAQGGAGRPDKHQLRQVHNATDAYGRMQSEWLLHADADEYLWAEGPVGDVLESVYPRTDCLIVPVAERIYIADDVAPTVFSGAFRRPSRKNRWDADLDALTMRGLTGHANGKAFSRRARDFEVSIHRPRAPKGTELQRARAVELTLLHFDGLTPFNWIYKLLRKADAVANHNGMTPSPHRQAQINAVLADPGAVFALHDRLKRPDSEGLRAKGLLFAPSFDPMEAL